MKRVTEDEPQAASSSEEKLHLKYRPRALKDVIGQDAIVKSLRSLLDEMAGGKTRTQCLLFVGPAGTGKTTLARIVCERLGVEPGSITETDAASNTGIDDIRELTKGLAYVGFGKSPNKAILLNECHRLSGNAWDSLLMKTEEPPRHVFFIFTTTDPAKIPKAMLTRCTTFNLNPVRRDDLFDLLEHVCDAEGFKTSGKVLNAVVEAAGGSPRAALVALAKVHSCDDIEEAETLLQVVGEDNAEVIDLARMLVRGELKWERLCTTLKELDKAGISPESIRLVLVNYLNACVMGSRKESETVRLLDMLAAFIKAPATGSEKLAPILVAFGRFIYP